jgi:ethanolamine utilization protein EutL
MMGTQVLATRFLANASAALCASLGIPAGYPSLAFLTADSDDPTYIALDEATKAADVIVAYTHSFYGGASNASTPYAGEVIGILAGKTPGAVQSGMEAALSALSRIGFTDVGVPCLAHTVSSCGSFLAKEAGVPEGSALAYLIAPPLESMYALDAALKAADVKLCKLYSPPTETNFGGALLTGSQSACTAAATAFQTAVAEVANNPHPFPRLSS